MPKLHHDTRLKSYFFIYNHNILVEDVRSTIVLHMSSADHVNISIGPTNPWP